MSDEQIKQIKLLIERYGHDAVLDAVLDAHSGSLQDLERAIDLAARQMLDRGRAA